MLWLIRDILGLEPIHLAYLCDTHHDLGWIQFDDWRRHVLRVHTEERTADIEVAYRNSQRRPNGTLRLGSMIRHT